MAEFTLKDTEHVCRRYLQLVSTHASLLERVKDCEQVGLVRVGAWFSRKKLVGIRQSEILGTRLHEAEPIIIREKVVSIRPYKPSGSATTVAASSNSPIFTLVNGSLSLEGIVLKNATMDAPTQFSHPSLDNPECFKQSLRSHLVPGEAFAAHIADSLVTIGLALRTRDFRLTFLGLNSNY